MFCLRQCFLGEEIIVVIKSCQIVALDLGQPHGIPAGNRQRHGGAGWTFAGPEPDPVLGIEGFGLPLVESMACGTPVVASSVGGIPEVVVHDETGLMVPFEPSSPTDAEPKHPDRFAKDLAAAIDALIGSPERRIEMGEAARQRVKEHFSWKSIARKTIEIYEQSFGA